MSHSPDHRFDQETHDALSELAQQPGEENLRAPIDNQGRIQLFNFAPRDKTPFSVTVQPDRIHVERVDGEPFGIADHSHDPDNPISVLGRRVTSLTVERSGDSWAVRQHPEQHIVVDNAGSFELFWRVVAKYVHDKRVRLGQQAAS